MSESNNKYMENNDDPQAEKFRKLFVGGLHFDSTEETIKQHFEQWGEIDNCVVVKNPETKKSRGFAFITYKTAEMLDDAQKNRPHKIDDRELDTKRATPRNGPNESQSVKKMFVGGLKDDPTEDEVREVFGQFGKIETLEMITDKTTGKQKGFCFITFDDFDSVDKCVLRQRISLKGKYVEVKKAVPKDQAGGMGGGRGGRGSPRGGMRGRGGFRGANNGGLNNGYGNQGNSDYPGNMGGYGGPGGYESGGPQGYGAGNQGGYNSGYTSFGGMGDQYGNYGGDFNDGYNNFGYGYASGYNSGPTRGAGFAQRGAGPYGNGYGSNDMGGYR